MKYQYVPEDMTPREFWRTLALLIGMMPLGVLPIVMGFAPQLG